MTKRKLTLMKPSELRDYREVWIRRICNYQPHSLRWKFCSWMIERIMKEIEFKDWILDGLKLMNEDKIKH